MRSNTSSSMVWDVYCFEAAPTPDRYESKNQMVPLGAAPGPPPEGRGGEAIALRSGRPGRGGPIPACRGSAMGPRREGLIPTEYPRPVTSRATGASLSRAHCSRQHKAAATSERQAKQYRLPGRPGSGVCAGREVTSHPRPGARPKKRKTAAQLTALGKHKMSPGTRTQECHNCSPLMVHLKPRRG
jgi:hypothetical protein